MSPWSLTADCAESRWSLARFRVAGLLSRRRCLQRARKDSLGMRDDLGFLSLLLSRCLANDLTSSLATWCTGCLSFWGWLCLCFFWGLFYFAFRRDPTFCISPVLLQAENSRPTIRRFDDCQSIRSPSSEIPANNRWPFYLATLTLMK